MPDFIDVENFTVEQQQAFRDAIKTPWASGQNNLRATFFDELPIGEQIIVGIDVDGEFNQAIVIPYNEPGGVPQIDDEGVIHARVSVVGGTVGEIQDEVFPKNELVIEWRGDTAVNLRVGDGMTPGGQVLATQPNQITGDPRPGNTLTSPVARQWFLNGEPVSGETGYTFEVPAGANPGDEIQQLNSNIIRVKPMAGVTAIRIDTRLPGSADDRFILSLHTSVPVNATVYWGDGTSTNVTAGGTSAAQHQYPEPGIYTIQISGSFAFYFHSNQDREKVIEVVQWSDTYPANQNAAFSRCTNLRSLPDDMSWDDVTVGTQAFYQCSSLKRLPHSMKLDALTNGTSMFHGCTSLEYLPEALTLNNLEAGLAMFQGCTSLERLPEGLTLSNLENGQNMFVGCQLIKRLPASMRLDALTMGWSMFQDCSSLEYLPESLTLNSLATGTGMFYGCTSLKKLPPGVTTPGLKNADYMFQGCTSLEELPEGFSLENLDSIQPTSIFDGCESLKHLPASMALNSIQVGIAIFRGCTSLETLPAVMSLNQLVAGGHESLPDSGMFQDCISLRELPEAMSLSSLEFGDDMFKGCTLSTESYSNLLQRMSVSNTKEDVTFDAGNSKYNTAGASAKSILTGNGWVFIDGGPA